MQPFDKEFYYIGGLHDGLRVRLRDASLNDPLTPLHEAEHGKIFTETPDGQVHKVYCLALLKGLVSRATAQAFDASAQELCRSACLPHESFATYLSIKEFSRIDSESLAIKLPKDYIEYYLHLSSIVDHQIPSNFAQKAFAWGCAVAVFSSPLIERFPSIDRSKELSLSADENPTIRFNSFLTKLKSMDFSVLIAGMQAAVIKALDENDITAWDFFSDDAWMERIRGNEIHGAVDLDGRLVEMVIADYIIDYCCECMPFTILRHERLATAESKFDSVVSKEMNMPLMRVVRSNERADARQREHFVQAALFSDSRIENTRAQVLERGSHDSLLSAFVMGKAVSFSVYSASPPMRHRRNWCVVFWTGPAWDLDAPPLFGQEYNREDVLEFLQSWIRLVRDGSSLLTLRSIVLPLTTGTDLNDYLECAALIWEQDELHSKLCLYWCGDVIQLYRAYAVDKQLCVECIPVTDIGVPANSMQYDVSSCMLNSNGIMLVLACREYGDCRDFYVRAMARQGTHYLRAVHEDLRKSGKLLAMSNEMFLRYKSLAAEALRAAKMLWTEY